MAERRQVRQEEITLAKHLISLGGLNPEEYQLAEMVDDYENAVMGSINFTPPEKAEYGGDIVRVVYKDSDDIPVVITLTKNVNNEILDMDFWKKDFSKLQTYPTPDKIAIFDQDMI
ncbi:hypothetical protein KMW28_23795 [Flammeovirga yaeyamensis]|uniref:DUF6984 domain-containing protein n=1 Tax=Flammeovirga yaeyamensis TaxID=367791 RepID=A0AAX1NCX9_9BACT|nr:MULTISPECIES: hypothetical protein [Flammeovirga]ANQ51626.1 hypothetical protein MY04_4284 [Flammeovirga sp. MY04]MBB3696600.1 putative lipase involved disintegration of autophagic bodies [Flammeovirga yaeyamensis]NMF33276.1 hypothetical protein [Flammeovirga yaeyamensis]QWG05445.1 hypothetical protein KMW28_23795 [Flammeovirga yaeyamensis]